MKILVAYDGSQEARRALDWTARLGEDVEVCVISVVPTLEVTEKIRDAVDPTSDVPLHRRELEEAAAVLTKVGIAPSTLLKAGNPAEEIIDAAAQGNFDMIVVGKHGMGAVRRFLIGSVADRVVRHAGTPVLVVQ
jgi:nucleotide-binding universal stress UspA family protein